MEELGGAANWSPSVSHHSRTELTSVTSAAWGCREMLPTPPPGERPPSSALLPCSLCTGWRAVSMAGPTPCWTPRASFTFSTDQRTVQGPPSPLQQPDRGPTGPRARALRCSLSQFPTNLTLSFCCRKNKSPSTLEIPANCSDSEL